jgi:hypothetical protein
MNITRGKIQTALKVVIYGPEGIGKSTFASRFPEPLFIDTEGSTKHMDIARMDKPTSWAMLQNQINYIKSNPGICKTLVIDTIDWAEQLCIDDICATYSKKGIEDFGYGNGYVYEKESFGRFLNTLEELVSKGINVVLTAHAQMRKFSQPDEIGEYDRWELKLGKKTGSQISPLVKEWADMVLFANYKTYAVATDKDAKKFKAQGGGRAMYTQHHACWDAKNRFGLSEEVQFDFASIAHIFTTQPAQVVQPAADPAHKSEPATIIPAEKIDLSDYEEISTEIIIPDGIPSALADLMKQNNVSEEEIRFVVGKKGYFPEDTPITNYPPDFINGVLVGAWQQVYGMICDARKPAF